MRFTSILFAGVKVGVRSSILWGGGLGSFFAALYCNKFFARDDYIVRNKDPIF
jgi:hypothetical protein